MDLFWSVNSSLKQAEFAEYGKIDDCKEMPVNGPDAIQA